MNTYVAIGGILGRERVMLSLGVQTRNVVDDIHPAEGFAMLSQAGFSCADFSLNGYLRNTDL